MEPGQRAPEIDTVDHRGEPFVLSERLRQGPVVLFFYPRDETPICTREACLFQSRREDLAALAAVAVGVSRDTPERHRAFAANHGLDHPLLSDADGRLRRAFGVRRRLLLLPGRETFVIAPDGTVRAVVRDLFSHERHVSVALDTVRQLI